MGGLVLVLVLVEVWILPTGRGQAQGSPSAAASSPCPYALHRLFPEKPPRVSRPGYSSPVSWGEVGCATHIVTRATFLAIIATNLTAERWDGEREGIKR